MRPILFALALLLARSGVANATDPPPNALWHDTGDGQESTVVLGVALDPMGNVYSAGVYDDSTTVYSQVLDIPGWSEGFLAKHDAQGNLEWMLSDIVAPAPGQYGAVLSGVTTGPLGHIYAMGSAYEKDVDFCGEVHHAVLSDSFFAQLNPDGSCEWSQLISDNGEGYATDLTVDGLGNVVVAGLSDNLLDIGDSTLVFPTYLNRYIAKFDPAGSLQWIDTVVGLSRAASIEADALGNVYVGDGFNTLSKLDPQGSLVWSQTLGAGTALVSIDEVTVGPAGEVLLTGTFRGYLELAGTSVTAVSAFGDLFTAMALSDGTFQWMSVAQGLDSNARVHPAGIAIDGDGNCYVTGEYSRNLSFEGMGFDPTFGGSQMFLVSYDPSGVLRWVEATVSSTAIVGEGVAANASGALAVGGSFHVSGQFGGQSFAGSGPDWVANALLLRYPATSPTASLLLPGTPRASLAVHPNPFNPATVITFSTPRDGDVRLDVVALNGRRLATLLDAKMKAGTHVVRWDGRDDKGSLLASGVYLSVLRTASGVVTEKMALVR